MSIHEKLSKLELDNVTMGFFDTCLYPSDNWNERSVYAVKKSDFAFRPLMSDFYVEAFNNQTFLQDASESSILKMK